MMVKKYLPVTVSKFRDYIFPVFCFGCGREGSLVCLACLQVAPPITLQRCLACQSIHAGGELCALGRKKFDLDYLVSRGLFHEWLWQPMLHAWKYNSARELDDLVKKFMVEVVDFIHWSVDSIIPVPLSRRRASDRGFNQAEVLAEALSAKLGIPVLRPLRRSSDKLAQAALPVENRWQNVRGAFEIIQANFIKNRSFLIIDDVVTSGATLAELAGVLKQGGAKSVSALTLLTATPS